jgi:hypothetical protein
MPTQPPPMQPPPGWAPGAPPPPPPAGGGGGKLVGLVLVAVVLVAGVLVGAYLGIGALTDDSDEAAADESSESASPSESEPTESESPTTAESPTAEPSPVTSETPSSPPTAIPTTCILGSPEGGKAAGAVLRGGGLEMPKPNGFTPMAVESAYTFADEVVTVGRQIEPQWIAGYALGGLSKAAGYSSLGQAAESVLSCMTGSEAFYRGFSGRTDQGSSAITVDGQDAWRITAEVRVDDPEVTVEGDVATVIVVEAGSSDSYGLFVSVVPIGAPMLIGQQEQFIGALGVQ